MCYTSYKGVWVENSSWNCLQSSWWCLWIHTVVSCLSDTSTYDSVKKSGKVCCRLFSDKQFSPLVHLNASLIWLGTKNFIQWESTIIFIACLGSYKVFIVLVVQSKTIKNNRSSKHSLSSQIQSEFIYLNFGRLAGIQDLYCIAIFSFMQCGILYYSSVSDIKP